MGRVILGAHQFEMIRLSPEKAQRYVRPGDFTYEVPLDGDKGIVASEEVPSKSLTASRTEAGSEKSAQD